MRRSISLSFANNLVSTFIMLPRRCSLSLHLNLFHILKASWIKYRISIEKIIKQGASLSLLSCRKSFDPWSTFCPFLSTCWCQNMIPKRLYTASIRHFHMGLPFFGVPFSALATLLAFRGLLSVKAFATRLTT